MTEILALIPARGGSKSIPRKNLLTLAGKPLIAYSIDHAHASKRVTRVIVSTDDAEIKSVALKYGAEVIDRPSEFAQDDSPDIDVFYHALKTLWEREGYMPQLVVHLRPTMPIRRDGDIDAAIQMLLDDPDADSLRSVSPARESPYKMWSIGAGRMTPIYNDDISQCVYNVRNGSHGKPLYVEYMSEQHSMPRQLLPQVYHQNGYIDVIRARTVLDKMQMAGDEVLPFIVTRELFELDYRSDIARVEREMERPRAAEYEARHAI